MLALAPFTAYAALLGAAATLVLLAFLFGDHVALTELVEVAVHDDTIVIDGRVVPRDTLRAALFVPGPQHDFLRLMRGVRPSIDLRFNRRDEAEALAEALGLGATARAVSFLTPSPLRQSLYLTLLVPVLAAVSMLARSGAIFVALVGVMGALVILPRRVRVGADGLATAWLFFRRFHPVRDIHRVEVFERRVGFGTNRRTESFVRLVCRDGDVDLLTADLEDARIVAARLERVMTAAAAGEAPTDTSALARLPSERAHDWLIRLRGAVEGRGATYRAAPVDPDALLRIAKDPTRPGDDRLTAAAALAASGQAAARRSLVEAANAIAEPAVRDGLLRIAEAEDDEALATAIDQGTGRTSDR